MCFKIIETAPTSCAIRPLYAKNTTSIRFKIDFLRKKNNKETEKLSNYYGLLKVSDFIILCEVVTGELAASVNCMDPLFLVLAYGKKVPPPDNNLLEVIIETASSAVTHFGSLFGIG